MLDTDERRVYEERQLARVPWSEDQVWNLIERQEARELHPYTCPDHSDRPLIPQPDGWGCPEYPCAYRQTWAHWMDVNHRHWWKETG